MNIKHLIFDIETVCDEELIRQVVYPGEEFSESWQAVHRYQTQLLEDSGGKSSFIPATFHLPISVAVVAIEANGAIAHIGTLDRPHFRPHRITDQFWRLWKKYNFPQFVTFNGRGFDLPVMELCAYRYGVNAKEWFDSNGPSYSQPRNRYSHSHFDLMDFFTNFGATRFNGGLNLAATLIGKPGKLDTKGSMVQDLYEAKDLIRIDDYCVCDALDTYFVFLRTQVIKGEISLEKEHELVSSAKSTLLEYKEHYNVLERYLDEFRFWQAPNEKDDGFYHLKNFNKEGVHGPT